MALVSMCISLMQEQLVVKVSWLASELGFADSDQKDGAKKATTIRGMKGTRRRITRRTQPARPPTGNTPSQGITTRPNSRVVSRPVSVTHQPAGRSQSAIPGTPLG